METSKDEDGGDMNHRVLIIEDEYLIAMDVEDMVSSSPVEADVVGMASNKENALILAPLADIALVDVNLSDGPSGPEIGRILAEEFGVTVIFMTANPEVVAMGVKGALGVVRKPVDSRTIEQSLQYAIARRSHQRASAPRSMQVFAA